MALTLTKETLPSLRRLMFPLFKAQFLHCKIKPATTVIFPLFNSHTVSYCTPPADSCPRKFYTIRNERTFYSRSSHQRNQFLLTTLGANIASLQSAFRLFSDFSCPRRFYHSQSRLSVNDNVFVLYLQSLVDELEEIRDEQSKNNKNFKTKKEEKMYIAKYQFLLGANEVITKILEKQSDVSELAGLLSDETDSDMRQMMQNEIETLGKDIQLFEEELIVALAGDELADNNDIILEVSAGVGGQEAMLFCAEVFHMYCQFGLSNGWNVSIIDKDENELGGCRKAFVEISGFEVYKWLKYEAGVHRVQRVPKTEKTGRIHTSTVSVSVLPQPREIDIQIDTKDLKIETFRGSGPGGQSVNTTDSAVRITHLPSGTVAECKKERSQIKNKEHAMKVLKTRLYQAQLEEDEANRRANRKMQIGSRGRSEKIRTYNFQQDRVTDHRVKENYSNLPDFMAGGGGLEELIAGLDIDYKRKVVESMVDQFELSLKKSAGGNNNKKV